MKIARPQMQFALFITAVVLTRASMAWAGPADPTPFYPKTAAQKTRMMKEFDRLFDEGDFKTGRVARPFKFEGRSRWHVNASLYNRCAGRGGLDVDFCTRIATIPNLQGKAAPRKGFEDDFSISVNSREFFYSCSAELFTGQEDPEIALNALNLIQETNPSVTKAPFVFVDCTCEPLSPDHKFEAHHATGCDAFGYATDASGS